MTFPVSKSKPETKSENEPAADPEERLAASGITLPPAMDAMGSYVPAARVGDTVCVSGQGPVDPVTKEMVTGRVGDTVTPEQARAAARQAGLNALAVLRHELGTLRGLRIVKVFGMVNGAPGFTGFPEVIDGCSDLMVEVFGAAGRHARAAIGVAELPWGLCVELEVVAVVDGEAH